jgi:hypothetical protein
MMSQRCHTCNQATQYPGAKCPAVHFLQEPLTKKFFRVGQEQQVQTPSTSQWTHSLALTNKHKHFGTKIYKLSDKTGYSYDMTV